jgi:hypothetical protein
VTAGVRDHHEMADHRQHVPDLGGVAPLVLTGLGDPRGPGGIHRRQRPGEPVPAGRDGGGPQRGHPLDRTELCACELRARADHLEGDLAALEARVLDPYPGPAHAELQAVPVVPLGKCLHPVLERPGEEVVRRRQRRTAGQRALRAMAFRGDQDLNGPALGPAERPQRGRIEPGDETRLGVVVHGGAEPAVGQRLVVVLDLRLDRRHTEGGQPHPDGRRGVGVAVSPLERPAAQLEPAVRQPTGRVQVAHPAQLERGDRVHGPPHEVTAGRVRTLDARIARPGESGRYAPRIPQPSGRVDGQHVLLQ